MKLTTTYTKLSNTLANIYAIVNDNLSSDDIKSIIFRASKDSCEVSGVNAIINYRAFLTPDSFVFECEPTELKDGIVAFQLNAKELMGIMNTFKTLSRTTATDLVIQLNERNKFELIITEVDTQRGTTSDSVYLFDNLPISTLILNKLGSLSAPEDMLSVDTNALLYYSANLLPIMSSDNQQTLFSQLIFGEKHVVAYNAHFNVVMDNMLPEIFQGIKLSYRAISFMKSVICNTDAISVSRTPQYLIFVGTDFEAYISYTTNIPNYSAIVSSINKEHGIAIDRLYFKDILKRVSLSTDAVTLNLKQVDGACKFNISNSRYNKDVDIIQESNMDSVGEINIKLMPAYIAKSIIGEDSQFPETLFIYFSRGTGNNTTVLFSDSSGAWNTLSVAH